MKIKPYHIICLGIPFLSILQLSPIRIYYNHTPSMPVGFYLVNKWYLNLNKNDTVMICLNDDIATYAVDRNYIKKINSSICKNGLEPLVKKIYGVPYDIYQVKHNQSFVNNQLVPNSYIHQRDQNGRPLFHAYSQIVKHNQYLIFGDSIDSFDSRYFGAINETNILGKTYYIGNIP